MIGYKLFNKDLTNQYGNKFEVGVKYKLSGDIAFGTNGYGFHFASNLEDTLRYGELDILNVNSVIGLVEASGEILTRDDEYYGYYDLHCSSEIKILKVLSREEVLAEADKMYPERLARFIQGYKLNEEELEYFRTKFNNNYVVNNAIDYYQGKGRTKKL